MTTNILTAGPADRTWIAELIAKAFQDLPAAQWLVPDPAERAQILPRNFEIYVEYALLHGRVHVTDDRQATAVWLPRGGRQMPPPEGYEERMHSICGKWTPKFFALDEAFDAHQPQEPHHHLAFLAVSAQRQGAGVGSALLRHHHATLDAFKLNAYLDASTTGSRDLYLRHGYQVLGEPYAVGDNGALFWPMWRAHGAVS